MDLSLTEDQRQLREAFALLLTAKSSTEQVRAAEATGFDPALWQSVVDVGWPSMGLPEAFDGGGATLADLVVVARECGRHLASVPFVESMVAGRLLAAAGAKELLDGVGDGTVIATLALQPVSGTAVRCVPAGAVAELLVALQGGELVAFAGSPGARPHTTPLPNFGSLPIADWSLDEPGLRRTALATGAAAGTAFERALDEWRVLTAAALDGLRQSALAIGVDYVKNRKAFGVPIGAFQAVQHRLADVSVAGDGAELLVHEAAWALDTAQPNASALAAMALAFSAEVAFRTCREALQFHGGYGYTLEYDIQLFFRRAKAWPLALGDLRQEYQRIAELSFAEGEG